jgi:NAD(P)H-hydrate epimerase
MYLIDPALVPEIDALAAREAGLDAMHLIGKAGQALADEILRRAPRAKRVLILAGPGNNGGDGYAAGAVLAELGISVRVLDVMGGGASGEAARQFAARFCACSDGALLSCDAPEELESEIRAADVIVDAIFGTGARIELPRAVVSLIKAVNAMRGKALLIAADVPTGVDARDGRIADAAFSADVTVTFGIPKRGMYAYPARERCGEIVIADLGLDCCRIAEVFSLSDRLLDLETVTAWIPRRPRNSHKGIFGRLLLLCGSQAYRGAASLACEAALRSGAGLTILASHPSVLELALSRSPEIVTLPMPEFGTHDRDKAEQVYQLADGSDAVLIGCGSGASVALCSFLWELLARPGAPLIMDADALNSLALHKEESLARLRNAKRRTVITPHPMELSRLTGIPVDRIQADRIGAAARFAEACRTTVILKGAGTVIAGDDGSVLINPTGSPALAKGGSGDVLAGAVASFVAQRVDPVRAAAIGVYFHGAAGDALASLYSEYGVLARELPEWIAREIGRATKQK